MNKADHDKDFDKALELLRKASKYLCADDAEQGDYCRCGSYVGAGIPHKRGCLYLKIVKFLKATKGKE